MPNDANGIGVVGLSAGVCRREIGVVVDCGGPLDQVDFAGSGAGIFDHDVDVVRVLLRFGGLKGC